MTTIDPRELHIFAPSRPDGVVCVAYRRAEPLDSMREVCGYPAGHPIHADPPNGDTPEDHSPRQDLRMVRGIFAAYVSDSEESYFTAMAAFDRLRDRLRQVAEDLATLAPIGQMYLDALDADPTYEKLTLPQGIGVTAVRDAVERGSVTS